MQISSSDSPSFPDGFVQRAESVSTPLDISRVATELAGHGIEIDPGFRPCQFAGGLANLNYLICLKDRWAVLRRPPDGPLPRGANDMVREHRILSALWQELPVAPRSLHLCADVTVIGVPFQILEFRHGVVVRGDKLAPLPNTKETGVRLSKLLVETLAQVHSVDPFKVGLNTLGRPEGFFLRQADGWIGRAKDVTGNTMNPAALEVAHWLKACRVPDEKTPVLLHSDFKLDNMLIDPETMRPTTLVDWDMATRGPALFDLATMLSYWSEPGDPDCMHRLAQMPTALPGFQTREDAANSYSDLTGCSIDAMQPYRVMTIFKLAVVFLQLNRRHETGETSDPRYAHFGKLGQDLFAFALDVARGRTF